MKDELSENNMKASEYKKERFGAVVPFDVIKKDANEYAEVFAEGSPALEELLKDLWSHGIETRACGNGYDERPENFSLENEQNIQDRYDTYLHTSGIKKMFMNKWDYEPTYHAYISIDKASVNEPEALMSQIKKSLNNFKSEAKIEISDKSLNYNTDETNKDYIDIHINVLRDKECTLHKLHSMTPEEALKSSLPEKNTFDKYFMAIKNGLEQYYEKSHQNKIIINKTEKLEPRKMELKKDEPEKDIISPIENYKSLTPWTDIAKKEIDSDIDIEKFSEKQLEQLVIAKRHGHDITVFANPAQTPEQIQYIYRHAEFGDDVSKYINNTEFDPKKLEARESAEFAKTISISHEVHEKMKNGTLNKEQSHIIRQAEKEKMDMSKIKIIANKNLTPIEMEYLKETLSKKEYSSDKIDLANNIISSQSYKKDITFEDTMNVLKGVVEGKSKEEIKNIISPEIKNKNIILLSSNIERISAIPDKRDTPHMDNDKEDNITIVPNTQNKSAFMNDIDDMRF